ncbi:hypothetical protein ACFP81_06700 [Deinococcus lacus]|uniref:Phosphodiester glycosidase domain-containing protein n=1 Tax=Deinococcus lacus TaxID=392561 RepID=A0ABW1YDZ8_9DEIO
MTYTRRGELHLLSFDPARYRPRVVSVRRGERTRLSQLVAQVGGVAGINGGYFDMNTGVPVDLVVQRGLMTASSLEKRAALGVTAQGQVLLGYPKPRYWVSGRFGTLRVNAVTPQAKPDLLTAFVGDGQTAVGATGLLTLEWSGQRVLAVHPGRTIPQRAA